MKIIRIFNTYTPACRPEKQKADYKSQPYLNQLKTKGI